MKKFNDIYQKRLTNCFINQPRHKSDILELDDTIKSFNYNNPYQKNLNRNCKRELLKINQYSGLSNGIKADINKDDYLYSYANIKTLQERVTKWNTYPGDAESAQRIYSYFKRKLDGGNIWLKLSEEAEGYYSNIRNKSWWTSFEIFTGMITENLYKIGIPNDLFTQHIVVLKVPIKIVNDLYDIRVPSTIDAYDSPIFYTTKDIIIPKFGEAIDLKFTPNLNKEVDEYIINEIKVEHLEFTPIELDESKKAKNAWMKNNMLNALDKFYTSI